MSQRPLARPLLLIASVGIGLAACEVALRVLFPIAFPITSYIFENDPELDYRPIPNLVRDFRQGDFHLHIHTNSQGFAGGEFSDDKPANEYRVLVLGDSFTWGGYTGNLDNGYPAILERRLAQEFSGTIVPRSPRRNYTGG